MASAGSQEVDENGKNLKKIKCTKCGSLILREGLGTLIKATAFEVPLMFQRSEKNSIFVYEELTTWWSVGDMFTFENIGLTHSYNGRKYLACADCEIGPVGLVDSDQSRLLIAIDRVLHN